MAAKKAIGVPTCANCDLSGVPLLACGRCNLVKYCGKDCQKQHWLKGDHKKYCLTLEQRKPRNYKGAAKTLSNDDCAICMDLLSKSTVSIFPCSHSFHASCVVALRNIGSSKTCPLCRAALPPTPESGCKEAIRRYNLFQNGLKGIPMSECNLAQAAEREEIARMFRAAADQGYGLAQLNIGLLYEQGWGVKQSDNYAVQWYQTAAGQGIAEAQYFLAVMHFNGKGVKQSDYEAVQLTQMAANKGHADAQFFLAGFYEEGRGVKQSDAASEARRWHLTTFHFKSLRCYTEDQEDTHEAN